MLLDGIDLSSFHILLLEGGDGREFMLRFGRKTHERMYRVATGEIDHLPMNTL